MLKRNICNFVGIATIATLVYGSVPVSCVYAENARVALTGSAPHARGSNDSSSARRADTDTVARGTVSRTAAGAPGRVSARGVITSNAMRGASGVARSASESPATISRSATGATGTVASANVARAGISNTASRATPGRATAVFNDISKIGGGYAQCREAYATCMDQFCANANDTYRRCFCSARFTEFRDTEDALDQAKTLLMQFEDNNLNAVDKTAAEVNAMYSATVGEAAIKRDTSGAAKILDQIGDLLSGKKKATTSSSGSLGVLSLDISTSLDDVWGGGDSIFSGGSGPNLSTMEGDQLYNAVNKQCTSMIADSCQSDAVLQMARSSYSILITQDCNAYAKKVDSQREAVKQTVRTAEKYLREARLEEYRSHNSADVNACIEKVRTAMLADTACGANYKRCMDYTGAYINQSTGEPIYSQRLFELTDVIKLSGVNDTGATDVLKQNTAFDKFLDSKRIFATSALDSCRDIANTVWTEFKRTALIEIAQAQDEKIEEIKMSCVSTMAECYDTQSSALKDFDDTTAQAAGAMSVYAAREMCREKVNACASLYGEPNSCKFDGNGKLISGGDNGRCGIASLLKFVDTVDTTRVTEACDTIIDNYLTELCTPTSGTYAYPYNCRSLDFGSVNDYANTDDNKEKTSLWAMVGRRVASNCTNPNEKDNSLGSVDATLKEKVELALSNIKSDMNTILSDICENTYKGIWIAATSYLEAQSTVKTALDGFYKTVYGGSKPIVNGTPSGTGTSWGICIENTVELQCQAQDSATGGNGYATYDAANNSCKFTADWYEKKCTEELGGIWENSMCYIM